MAVGNVKSGERYGKRQTLNTYPFLVKAYHGRYALRDRYKLSGRGTNFVLYNTPLFPIALYGAASAYSVRMGHV